MMMPASMRFTCRVTCATVVHLRSSRMDFMGHACQLIRALGMVLAPRVHKLCVTWLTLVHRIRHDAR
jgi:hypothetical protein